MDILNESSQEYIWFAEYEGGHILKEFDKEVENSFDYIEQDHVNIFGLAGLNGNVISFNKEDGRFKIAGMELEFEIKDEGAIPYGSNKKDLITFKHAYTDFKFGEITGQTVIDAYYVGYKTKTVTKDGELIDVKIIFCIQPNKSLSCGIRISSENPLNKELDVSVTINGNEVKYLNKKLDLKEKNADVCEIKFS